MFKFCPINIYLVDDIISYVKLIISNIFHILHYMDLLNMVSIYKSKNINSQSQIKGSMINISVTLTLMFYQSVIYSTTGLIKYFLYHKLRVLASVLNLFILMFYHSFYCFNNLWQHKKILMSHRLDIHEKLWPYYLGYGFIASVLYSLSEDPYIITIYNMYMILTISIPFLTQTIYPSETIRYFTLDLSIFADILGRIYKNLGFN